MTLNKPEVSATLQERIPKYCKKILNALNGAGFEAYIVGGAVRDLLLGTEPADFDITTSAVPEKIAEVCRAEGWHTVDNLGGNFGCVVAVVDKVPVEITTFRGESYDGSDAHRPSSVWYCRTLKEDLSRRDFTVNAMALDSSGRLYDYFGGRKDLERRLLRTVGPSQLRYAEDALRMFRACRLTAQLGFTYVQDEGLLPPFGMEGTPYFLEHNFSMPVERCTGLSLERVRRELDRLLTAPCAGRGLMLLLATGLSSACCRVRENGHDTLVPILPELQHLAGLRQNPRFHCYDVWEHTLAAVDNGPRDLPVRWALLLHDIGKGMPGIRKPNKEGQPSDHGHEALSAKMAEEIFRRLRFPSDFSKLTVWLIAQHMRFAPMLITGERTLLRWVRAEAVSGTFRTQQELTSAYARLVQVFLADMGATHARSNEKLMYEGRQLGEQVVELARTRMPVHTGDLDLSGRKLMELIPREQIRSMLAYLLERVQTGSLENNAAALMEAARKNISRKKQETETNA